jgi:hypothetical protein
MDATQLALIESEIESGINTAAGIASVVAPQYAGFIVLGQAVAAAFPPLLNDVLALINQTDPSAADQSALAAKIAALANPAAL